MTDALAPEPEGVAASAVADEPPAMCAERLDAWFGDTRAVCDVSLEFPANEVLAIIGPSGCGKSTLLRCLNRMHETNPVARVEGRVLLHGADIYAGGVDPNPNVLRPYLGIGNLTDGDHLGAAGTFEDDCAHVCGGLGMELSAISDRMLTYSVANCQ